MRLAHDGESLSVTPDQPANALPYWKQLDLDTAHYVTARSGTTWDMRGDAAFWRVDPLATSYRNVLVCWGGANDLLGSQGDAQTAAETLTGAETYAAERRAAGWDVVIGLTLPHSAAYPSDAERLAYNTALKASESFDAVADVAADERMQDGTDTTYFSDGLHFTQAGAGVVAEVLRPLLQGHVA